MDNKILLLCIVFIPLAGAFALPLLAKISSRLRNLLSLLFVLSSFILSLYLIPQALAGKTIIFSRQFAMGVNLVFAADGLAVFMACVSSLISAIIVLYSFGYIRRYENQNEYYCMVTLFLGSMMGLIFSANLIVLYIFWEITAIASWRLIGFFREREYVLKADKAFLMTFFGAVVMLIGFIMVQQQAGSFDLLTIKGNLKGLPISNIAALLILVGIFSKSATLPFHTWLPDAGIAPSPVTALLHAAVLVKIGVYVFARLFIATFGVEQFWYTVVPVVAAVSALVSAGAALVETDIKRIIAYSTISQIGFIFFGLATGNEAGIAGGLLFILMHGLAKAGLFLGAGVIEHNTHIRNINKLGGLAGAMPVTAVSFLCCAFSVMGIPPFGGFFSKYMVFRGAAQSYSLFISIVFLAGAFLTILYLLRLFTAVFLGPLKTPGVKEGSRIMVFSVLLLAILSLACGIFINYPSDFARAAAEQMMGAPK